MQQLLVNQKSWGKTDLSKAMSQMGLKSVEPGVWAGKDVVVAVPNAKLVGRLKPNVRSYLAPSGWTVMDLGEDRGQHLGYVVAAPYHAGTLVTFRRGSSRYPLLLARWRHLRGEPLVQRYKSRAGARRALNSFLGGKCEAGGAVCPTKQKPPYLGNAPRIKKGDRVGYSAKWLRSVGVYTGELPQRRGTVVSVRRGGRLVSVKWDDGETNLVAMANLAKPGTVAFGDAYVNVKNPRRAKKNSSTREFTNRWGQEFRAKLIPPGQYGARAFIEFHPLEHGGMERYGLDVLCPKGRKCSKGLRLQDSGLQIDKQTMEEVSRWVWEGERRSNPRATKDELTKEEQALRKLGVKVKGTGNNPDIVEGRCYKMTGRKRGAKYQVRGARGGEFWGTKADFTPTISWQKIQAKVRAQLTGAKAVFTPTKGWTVEG
jgi:hypothetical protein